MWMEIEPITLATCVDLSPKTKEVDGLTNQCLHGEMKNQGTESSSWPIELVQTLSGTQASPRRREGKHQIGWGFITLSKSWRIKCVSMEEKIEFLLHAWTVGWDNMYTETWKKKRMEEKFLSFLLQWIQIRLFCWIQIYLLVIYRLRTLLIEWRIINIFLYSLYFTEGICDFLMFTYMNGSQHKGNFFFFVFVFSFLNVIIVEKLLQVLHIRVQL